MTAPALITSLQNPCVKQVVALRDRRGRERSGKMRVEGFEELSLALASGARPRSFVRMGPYSGGKYREKNS